MSEWTILRQSTLRLGRRYGVALSLESVALFASVYFLRRGANTGDYLAAFACGLQNAMVTTYSSASMRTTHMTGMVTDLGIACGHLLRGVAVDRFRFRIYAVLLPAARSGSAGIRYTVVKHLERRHRPA